MMEEASDDTNGESTFEFVGGKMDEQFLKDEIVSSPSNLETATTVLTPSSVSVPSSNNYAKPPDYLSAMQSPMIPVVGDNSGSSPPVSIPMYNPSQQPGSSPYTSLKSPLSPTQMFYEPISSVPPPATQSQSPVNPYSQASSYVQNVSPTAPPPLQQTYMQPEVVTVPQSALDLPVDDSYASSTGPTFQGSGQEKGVWGWIKGNEFLNKVAEKAKHSVDSVITTLDPGMKEIIYSGGDVHLVVASGNEAKISAIREAFQQVFGKATVEGIAVQSVSIAPQPVGYSAGSKAAEERISNLRQQGLVHEHQPIIAIENFLAELIPDKWYDLGCIILSDPMLRVNLQLYTQAIPVDSHFVMQAKERTPPDFHLGWSGFAVTIGEVIGPALGVHHSEWHQALTGISRREILFLAAKTIAGLYKSQLRR